MSRAPPCGQLELSGLQTTNLAIGIHKTCHEEHTRAVHAIFIIMDVAMIMAIAMAMARHGYAYAVPSYGYGYGFDGCYGYD